MTQVVQKKRLYFIKNVREIKLETLKDSIAWRLYFIKNVREIKHQ